MLVVIVAVVIAAALGAVAGAVSAFTHQLFINRALAKVRGEVGDLEAKLKAKL